MWWIYALLSAVFAALTAILAKIGVKDINSNLATAIRTAVILVFAWMIVAMEKIKIKPETWDSKTVIFLILSGIATGLSWLFYFRALQLGEASKVAPIDKLSLVFTIILAGLVLREKITTPIIIGTILMTAGAVIMTIGR